MEQEITEGDLRQGLAKDGLADGADGGLELVDPGLGGDPARGDVQFGDAAVVMLEEGQQVLRQVALILVGQGADDAEVHGDVAAAGLDEDVAGVHVGMKEVVAEDLGEEDLHPTLAQQLHADPLGLEPLDLPHRSSIDPLHDQDAGVAQVPVDLGHVKRLAAEKVLAQLAGVGRLALQVELIEDGLAVVVHHLHRPQAAAIPPVALGQLGDDPQQTKIAADDGLDTGADHLDHHLAAVLEAGAVDLGDGGRG